ncbi:MAG: peptidase S41 [Planctomycetes bacterium]|nr:peptidase S41 [Planctomycetota bacterium]
MPRPSAVRPALAALLLAAAARAADVTPDARMLRYPDVSATHVAFVYADDIWLVPREGGTATPLASPAGPEQFPRFSPDGRSLAYVGNHDGNRDLYVVPVDGGVAQRVTHHPAREQLSDWTPDGRLLFSSAHEDPLGGRAPQVFRVGPAGGLPERLPVPYGGNAALSPDGRWLAYTPVPFDFRTWKRYTGGTAMDIWLFDLQSKQSRRMTDWIGSDSQPMWLGTTVYYLSDAGHGHLLQLWSFDTIGGVRSQVTDLPDFDVKWPAMGPGPDGKGEIVFQHGSRLMLLSLRNGELREVKVRIPGDRPKVRPRTVDVAGAIESVSVSPTGKRVAVEARGDVWTLPAEHGSPRNLTRSDTSTERMPSWSPDGRWLAWLSDAGGEYELWLAPSDGAGAARQLTRGHEAFFSNPRWSPDSKRIALDDQLGNLHVVDAESGAMTLVDTDPWGGTLASSWSHDGAWLAYVKSGPSQNGALWLWEAASGARSQLTSGMFNDREPCFDREGKYLYFSSLREWSGPTYEDLGTTFVYAQTERLLVVPLRAEVPSPWLPKSDEEPKGEEARKEAEKQDQGGEDGKDVARADEAEAGDAATAAAAGAQDADRPADKPGPPKEPLAIDVDGFERRALLLPVPRGNFLGLAVTHDGKLVYGRRPPYDGGDEPPRASVKLFDVADEKEEEQTLADKADGFELSADGKRLLVFLDGKADLRDPAPGAEAKPVVAEGLTVAVDPRDEWREILVDAWRRFRDFFYDPNMHGVDWDAMRERYVALLPDCASREDVAYLIRELISELNVGHAYYNPGEAEEEPSVSVGLLGCDFALEQGAFRIARIHEGAAWDADARGPLSQPGVDVKAGDFLLAVNGAPLDTARDPWAAFQGLAGRVVELTVNATPATEGARKVLVEPVASESGLRYRGWIERNRQHVSRASGGRVGYVHVPDTGVNGQDNLFRQFHGQKGTAALIVDERFNGGGQIPTRFIELLNRPSTNSWAVRAGAPFWWPPDSHQGPKCMLINQRAGSGGDCFPYYFRQAGLGPLIGMRTWGGLVGIGDLPPMLDGASVSVPSFAFYENDGTWGVEGWGVDPDIEVLDDPARMQDGADPQLDKAIEVMLAALDNGGAWTQPKVPAYPDRRGMGLKGVEER